MSGDRSGGGKSDETGFASRWSRLKREAEAEPEIAESETEDLPAEAETPEEDLRPDEEIIEELGLPDPETLKTGDDFSAFMAKAVPARIRNRALRKLWISNPVLANLDELLDYGEDFTDAATVIENLQTGYQVGKGWVKAVAGEEEEEPGEETGDEAGDETEAETGGETEEGDESDAAAADDGDAPEPSAPEPTSIPLDEQPADEEIIPPRPRMRFRVAED